MTEVAPQGLWTAGQLQMRRCTDAHGVVIALRGELDLASAPALEHELNEIEIEATIRGRLLIDLRGLGFMDCTGIALLIRARESAQARGYQLALRPGSDQVQRLFTLTGLLDHFVFGDSA